MVREAAKLKFRGRRNFSHTRAMSCTRYYTTWYPSKGVKRIVDSTIETVTAAVLRPRIQSASNKESSRGVHVFEDNPKLRESMTEHDTRRVGNCLWCGGADRDRLV